MTKELKICMAGFGNLGKRFSQLLMEKEEYLAKEYGCRFTVTGISTRSRGTIINTDGINLQEVLDMIEENGRFSVDYPGYSQGGTIEMLKNSEADIFIEISTLSIKDGQPAAGYMKLAFEQGMHVITANKGPEVWHYKELKETAEKYDRQYLYETIVMNGAPIFNLMKETLHGNRLLGFRGILNGTSNYVLGRMEEGFTYDEAIKEAQQIGIAEADPSLDMGGWDGVAKLCSMANIFMDCCFTPDNVEVVSLENITKEEIDRAKAEGLKIKYICEVKYDEEKGKTVASVTPQKLSSADPLYNTNSTSMAVTFNTDLAGELTITQTNPGILQTAYGVYSDIITLIKNL